LEKTWSQGCLPIWFTWEPDLSEDGAKSERLCKVYGEERLTDTDRDYPAYSFHRFFKVTVEMP